MRILRLNKNRIGALLVVLAMLLESLSGLPLFAVESAPTLEVGDYIYLGEYEGERLTWRCVDIDARGPLMLLTGTIANRAFSESQSGSWSEDLSELTDTSDSAMREDYGSNLWSESELRGWLNSESGFLSDSVFTETERYVIMPVSQDCTLSDFDAALLGGGVESVTDRVFCLDSEQLAAALENGLDYVLPASESEQYWLRTPSADKSYAVSYMTVYGVAIDTVANNSDIGVRPAFYANPDALSIESGSGTESSPYVIYGSAPVAIEQITLSASELSLGKGMTKRLTAEISPENANDKTLVWSSSDRTVVTVSSDGAVTALEVGSAVVRVSSRDGSVFAECEVVVTEREVAEFVDATFKQAVIDTVLGGDRELDAPIYADELLTVTELTISGLGITDLSGIEYFPALTTFYGYGNRIPELSFAANPELTYIDCTNSQVKRLDVSKNPKLASLYCAQNSLEELELSANPSLYWLDCSGNNLSSLDISANAELQFLCVSSNALESLDLSACEGLISLECQNNRLTSLELSANRRLTSLICSGNMLEKLDISQQTELSQLYVSENRLEELDISANTALIYLDCSRNYFKAKSCIAGLDEGRTTLDYYPQYLVLIPVEGVSLSPETLSLKIGETANLTASVTPEGATNKLLRFTCDDSSVASVSENGRVTAYTPGKCTVTVTTDDGGFTASCEVEVIDNVAPTAPSGLKADYVTGSGTGLSWQASSDNVRVLRYDIYRNGSLVGSSEQTSFVDSGLAELEEYIYSVAAVDTSENKSPLSAEFSVIPRGPRISRVEPADGASFGGEGTQVISVRFADTNNSLDASLLLELEDENGDFAEVGFEVKYSSGKSGSDNILYAEFDKASLPSGDRRFRLTVADKDGNRDSVTLLYTVDKTPPQKLEDFAAVTGEENVKLSWAGAREADVVKYEIYRAGTISGVYQLYATVNGRANTSFVDAEVFTGEVYYYKAAAVDGFGQRGELTDAVWATPSNDETIPTVTKLLPANNSAVNKITQISVTAQDNIKVATLKLQYSTDGSSWSDYASVTTDSTARFDFDTSQFPDGTVYIRALAYDVTGNVSSGRPVYTYRVDNTGPAKVTNVSTVAVTSTTVTLAWANVPDDDFAAFTVERKNPADGSFSSVGSTSTTLGMNILNLAPSTSYTYRVVAYDTLGNRGIESDEITVTTQPDTTAPVITRITPSASRYSSSVPMKITASDEHLVTRLEIECSYDLVSWVSAASLAAQNPQKSVTFDFTLDLAGWNEGSLYVRPVAYDAAGNVSDCSGSAPFVEYYVDRTPPARPEGFELIPGNGFIELKWKQGTESDLAGYTVLRSNSADGSYTAIKSGLQQVNYIDKSVELGQVYYYKLAVSDTAGNMSAQTPFVYGQMAEDKEKPIIYSFSPSDGFVISKKQKLSILAGDNHRVASVTLEYLAADGAWTLLETKQLGSSSGLLEFGIDLDCFGDGNYSFRAFAVDASGNVGDYSAIYSYTVDTIAPSVSEVSCSAGEESVKISWSSTEESDLAGFRIYRRTESSGYSRVGSLSASGLGAYEFDDYNLSPDVKYMFKVAALDAVGNEGFAESGWIYPNEKTPEADSELPFAAMNVVSVMEVDVEEYFDASPSRDNVGIASYLWDFGDGTTSEKAKAIHSYPSAGTYTVTLTVTDLAGNSSSRSVLVTVEERRYLGAVTVSVRDTLGNPVVGAGVYFNLGDENASIYGTNVDGEVVLREYEGIYPVGVYCDGYLPAKLDVQIIKNTDDAVYDVVIEKKEIIVGELTHERMTLDEIIAAGIDPYKPENQNIYRFEIVLTYGREEYVATGFTKNTSDPVKLTITDSKDDVNREVYAWSYRDWGTTNSGGGSYTGKPQTIIAVIEMPGEASWLKEFFSVHLHLENQADEQFAIDDCVVTLNYPESGLTLMNGLVDKYSESKNVNIGTLMGQQEKDVFWILRGDKAGDYDISADFKGVLRDFNEEITAHFEAASPIEVFGSENLFLDIWVEDSIAPKADCAIRVGITNEGTVDVYLPKISLDNLELIRSFKTKNDVIVKTDPDVLTPGESIWVDYRIPRSINENLTEYKDKEFYLYSAVVNSIGGNAALQHRFNVVPAYTISPDMINVYERDSAGNLQPLKLIQTGRGLSPKVPEIVIETLELNENMEFVPASRQVTIVDDFLVKKNKNLEEVYGTENLVESDKEFVIETDENGLFTLKGYDIGVSLVTMEPYNITISSPRAVAKTIPVVMRDYHSETTTVEGHVYYNGIGTSSPLAGAEVIIGDKVTKTDLNGRFYFEAIGVGKNEIIIKKSGYEEIHELVSISEYAHIDYYLNKIENPNEPHIKSVSSSVFTGKNGNATIIPEGTVEGYAQFTIMPELKEELFVKHRYYIIDENSNVVSSGDIPAYIFSFDFSTLKVGEQLLFTLVTQDADGNLNESQMYDTNIIIAETPSFFDEFVMHLNDLDDLGKFKSFNLLKTTLSAPIETETQIFRGQSLFQSTWINTSDESAQKASYLLEGFELNSKSETEFPLKAEYNIDGTFKISFGAKTTQTAQSGSYYQSVGNYTSYANRNLYYEHSKTKTTAAVFDISSALDGDDKILDVGGSAMVDLIIKYVPSLRDWSCTLNVTIEGHVSTEDFEVQIPVAWGIAGGYGKIEAGASAKAKWTPVSTYLSDIFGFAEFKNLLEPKEIVGGVELKAGVGVYALDADVLSGGIYAKLNADVYLAPQQKLLLGYAFGIEGEVLLWTPSVDLLKDKFEIRVLDGDTPTSRKLMRLMAASEETLTIASADGASEWSGDAETLKTNVFNGSKPRLLELGDGQLLMVFADLDESRDVNNPVQMMYSLCADGIWSEPRPVYDDGTVDLYPQLASDENGNVYLTFINMSEPLSNASEITFSELRAEVYPKLQVVTTRFDAASGTWSAPQTVSSGEYFKKHPQIASDGNITASVWVQNRDNLEYGTADAPDTLGYSFSGGFTDSGELELGGDCISSIAVSVYRGSVYVAYTRASDGITKVYLRSFNGCWSEEVSINRNAFEDKCLRFANVDGELYLYYVNNDKIYRYSALSDKVECVAHDDDFDGLLDFEIVDENNLIRLVNYMGRTAALLTCRDGSTASTVMLELGGEDSIIRRLSAAKLGDELMLASIETSCGDEISNSLKVRSVEREIGLSIDSVASDNDFIPGIANSYVINVSNGGLVRSDGFEVYCSASESVADSFGEPFSYANYLEPGRGVTLIASAELPADYCEPYVYFIVKDSDGKTVTRREKLVFDSLSIGEIRKDSDTPGSMSFIVDVDNLGYIENDALTLSVKSSDGESVLAETQIEALAANATRTLTLSAELGEVEGELYLIELCASDGTLLDSRLVQVSESDYRILLGDYFCDGDVNPNDAAAILQRIAYSSTDSERQLLAGDINENGQVEPNDVTAILRYCAGLIDNFSD